MTVNRIGLFPGTFDPVTLGHLDLIKRSSKLVSTLIVGVAKSYKKEPFFEELQVLLDIEHDLETETLPWPKSIKDGFSSADLGIMEKFFDMESFENPKVNVNTGVIPQSLKRNVNTPSI